MQNLLIKLSNKKINNFKIDLYILKILLKFKNQKSNENISIESIML